MTTLQTDHLTLCPISSEDMPELFAIYSDERAMRFMPSPPHKNIEDTMEQFVCDLALDGAFHWAICLKDSDKVIGHINFLGQTRIPGMGYILHPDYWERGITTEAARVALDYGFANLGYDRVELWIDETNSASTRVAQKLGFKAKGRLPLKYGHRTNYHFMVIWGMLKSEWQSDSQNSDSSPETQFYSVEPVLKVHDIIATAEYYRDKLGFHIDFLYGEPTYYAILSRGEWTGNMVSIHLSQILTDSEINPSCNLHIRIGETLDELFEQYRDKGVTIVEAPEDKPWGLREFTIRDLNGHRLVFARYV